MTVIVKVPRFDDDESSGCCVGRRRKEEDGGGSTRGGGGCSEIEGWGASRSESGGRVSVSVSVGTQTGFVGSRRRRYRISYYGNFCGPKNYITN